MNQDSLDLLCNEKEDFKRKLHFTEAYDPMLVTPTKQKPFDGASHAQALIEDNEVAFTRSQLHQLNNGHAGRMPSNSHSKLERFLSPSPHQQWAVTSPQVVKLDFANVKRSAEKNAFAQALLDNGRDAPHHPAKNTQGNVELVPFEMEQVTGG
jgi:hypothetical protein